MQALILAEYEHFEVLEAPQPEIEPDEVLLEVRACGICGSDVHGMDGSTGRRRPPIIMGHEAAGVIAQVGQEVEGWAAGDRVTFDSTIYCGKCRFCRDGQINLCDNRRVFGVSCDDYRRDGAFAEYVAAPQRVLHRLPDTVSFRHAAMVEPLSVALHAVNRTKILPGDTAVVIGAGVIGLLAVQVLRRTGCRIIAVDLDQGRLELAGKLGAHESLLSDAADVPAEVFQQTGGRGADIALEAVGISPTVQTAVACVRKGGQVTLVGNLAPQVDLPLQAVVTRQLALGGSCASSGEYPACLDMLARGDVEVEAMISATAPLAEGPDWFRQLYEGNRGLVKVILQP